MEQLIEEYGVSILLLMVGGSVLGMLRLIIGMI